MRLISDLIIFVFDPTPASGYSVDSQIELYKEVKQYFTKDGEIEIIIVINKMDLASPTEIKYLEEKLDLQKDDYFLTNALNGKNLDKITSYFKERYVRDG